MGSPTPRATMPTRKRLVAGAGDAATTPHQKEGRLTDVSAFTLPDFSPGWELIER
jgi:hypothetical protein